VRTKKARMTLLFVAIILLLPWSVAYASDGVVGYVANASTINDTHFDKQWALTKIQAPDAWQITAGSQDVLIAVLDTGIDMQHEDLADKVVASMNFTSSPTTADLCGHGTHIAGTIAANANNSLGIAGVVPNCRLINVKVVNDDGICDSSKVAKGIVWAANNGAKVINLSLTFNEPDKALEDAVNYAWGKGVIIVAAAGNDGGSAPSYPACYENCLAVTATNSDDLLIQLAQYGDWVDVATPGANIYSTLPGNGYGYKSGTSMATAFASGVAGLLFSVVADANGNGRLNDEVRHEIETHCDEVGNPGIARGRVNALKAISN
jgi:thermitase